MSITIAGPENGAPGPRLFAGVGKVMTNIADQISFKTEGDGKILTVPGQPDDLPSVWGNSFLIDAALQPIAGQ